MQGPVLLSGLAERASPRPPRPAERGEGDRRCYFLPFLAFLFFFFAMGPSLQPIDPTGYRPHRVSTGIHLVTMVNVPLTSLVNYLLTVEST